MWLDQSGGGIGIAIGLGQGDVQCNQFNPYIPFFVSSKALTGKIESGQLVFGEKLVIFL